VSCEALLIRSRGPKINVQSTAGPYLHTGGLMAENICGGPCKLRLIIFKKSTSVYCDAHSQCSDYADVNNTDTKYIVIDS